MRKQAKPDWVARWYQDPDLRLGNEDIAGCVSRRSSHLQLISLEAPTKWPLCSLDMKNARLHANVFDRGVYLRDSREQIAEDFRRVRKLRVPAYELSHAAASFHVSLRDYLVRSAGSPPSVGRRKCTSFGPFGPRMFFVYRKWGAAVGAIATHIDDVSGRGEPDLLLEERLGNLAAEEGSFAHVGMALSQEEEFPATLTQADSAKNPKPLPTSSASRAGREESLSMDFIKLRQCKSGGVHRVIAVKLPDICARLARIASSIHPVSGSGVFRKNELGRVVKDWRRATALSHALGRSDKVRSAPRTRESTNTLRIRDTSGVVRCS